MFEIADARWVGRKTRVLEHGQARALAAKFRRVGAGNSGAVPGDIDPRNAGAPGCIALRTPGPITCVEEEPAAGEVGKLGLRSQSEAEAYRVAGDPFLNAALLPRRWP